MATKSQKKALNTLKTNVSSTKKLASASKAAYNTASSNYTNAVNTGYSQGDNTKSTFSNWNNTINKANSMAGSFKYDPKYTGKVENLLNEAENKEFNYSVSEDPAYKALANSYVQKGKLAMQDAVGESVASTGGYGSTAAQAAGQQAYNNNLTNLNEDVAGLYQNAYSRYSDQKNLLTNLASAYQSMDTQGYDQALQSWQSNYDSYVSLANEYNNMYQYLDSSDRAAYEQKLDGLYNIMTSKQSQYNTDQGISQNAKTSYVNATSDVASYDETVRANKASEAAAAAQLAEQKRSNIANEKINSIKANENTSNFEGNDSTTEVISTYPKSRIKESPSYKNSVLKAIKGKYNNKELTSTEFAYLMDYYQF